MNQITQNMRLDVSNVFSYKYTANVANTQAITDAINDILTRAHAEKTGPTISTFKAMAADSADTEVEILVPIDREIITEGKCTFKPRILIENALKMHYEGNMNEIGMSILELNQFIIDNHLTPITNAYCVHIKEPTEEDPTIIEDIYVGISSNIL